MDNQMPTSLTWLDLILVLLGIGISSVTPIHWGFTIAIALVISKTIDGLTSK